MLLAPGRRRARCPGWPPAARVIWCRAPGGPVPAAGPRAADRHGAQGGHRRGGWIWCGAPGCRPARCSGQPPAVAGSCCWPSCRPARAADQGSEVARTPLTGERGFLIGSASGGIMLLARAADRHGAQGGHRRGGWIWYGSPPSSVLRAATGGAGRRISPMSRCNIRTCCRRQGGASVPICHICVEIFEWNGTGFYE
ncbi:hypothetical protein D3C78_216320 [compost metagenome]